MTHPTPDWLLLASYGHPRGEFDAAIILGQWQVIMAQHSPADLRPIRVRGEARERRRAG